MELDDLKEQWKTASFRLPFDMKEALEKRITALERSGKSIRRTFMIEMTLAVIIYFVMVIMVWSMGEKIMSYMYKLLIVGGVGTIPVAWRLYKSQKWINSMDYSRDVRSNMIAFLNYYKNSLRIYKWSIYLVSFIMLVLMYTDNDFAALGFRLKLATAIYILAVSILTEPYIRILYGRRIEVFENFLKD